MRYALLVYTDESLLPALMTPETIEGFNVLGRELSGDNRRYVMGGLDSVATSTTVRVRDGQVLLTDGPFAETKEQLGGFSIAMFDSMEAALAMAARVPTATAGCVEVRPVREMQIPG